MRIPAEVIPRQYPSIRTVAVAPVFVGVKPLPARLRLSEGLGIRSRDYINIFHCKTLMLVAKQYYSTEHGVQPSCMHACMRLLVSPTQPPMQFHPLRTPSACSHYGSGSLLQPCQNCSPRFAACVQNAILRIRAYWFLLAIPNPNPIWRQRSVIERQP
jgi:hypothetical protein